ncbi:MAG: tRNA lysidine(34) synthetase TilS [Firmicutes bacterium]|nr:tRNA lysidine(34) synthetase TilS [Bacillota bacterium]
MSKDLMPEFTRSLGVLGIGPRERVLIAVSGGPDSMALLHLFLRWDLTRIGAFHLNHRFRKEADRDAQLVKDYCRGAGIPVKIVSYDVEAYLKESGESKQQGAREIRYQLLREYAAEQGYDRIALAHHGDDQAETVLMRILRGSGLHGLGSIPPARDVYIRPLLAVYKKDILIYCKQYGLPYAEDASNWEPIYLRNKIRRELIPLLEKEYNPNIRAQLVQMAELVREDELELQKKVESICRRHSGEAGGQLIFPRPVFRELSLSLQRRVLRALLRNYRGHLLRIGYLHIEAWRKKLLETSSFQLDLPQVSVSANADYIFVGAFQGEQWEAGELPLPGKFQTKAFTVKSQLFEQNTLPPRPENCEDFDFDSLKLPLFVRRRHPGDRLRPLGGPGSKKIKDLLIDARIPAPQRDFLPIVTDQNSILWIPTVRRSAAAVLSKKTRRIVRLSFNLN